MDYRILYIDEVQGDRHDFQSYVELNSDEGKFQVDAIEPEENLEEFIEKINNENYDAIITDHQLGEEKPSIQYDGVELVQAFLKVRLDYPCFILTGWEDDAIRDGYDVNIVYPKGIKSITRSNVDKHQAVFIDKIENQIKHHKDKISALESEYKELLNKETLDSFEDDRLVELDTMIEKMTNQSSSIPKDLKKRNNLDELHKMINNTDTLIERLKGL
ncbi:hypothetical protein [Sulfurimonas sp.]|uniref:hypothetical protein n=1 Tax=Sulfurimonas sp. TaxID=2022749 RepID=UPI00356A4DC2